MITIHQPRMFRRGAIAAVCAIALAACGSDSDSTGDSGTAAAEVPADTEAASTPDSAVDETAEATPDEAPEATTDAVVATASSELGDILVDSAGFSLYGFTDDVDGTPTCDGGCAEAWPPLIVDDENLPDGLDGSVFSVVERNDGSFQLKAGDWPLYLFAGDTAAGQTNGQESGGVWFVAAPDGSLIGVEPVGAAAGDGDAAPTTFDDGY